MAKINMLEHYYFKKYINIEHQLIFLCNCFNILERLFYFLMYQNTTTINSIEQYTQYFIIFSTS